MQIRRGIKLLVSPQTLNTSLRAVQIRRGIKLEAQVEKLMRGLRAVQIRRGIKPLENNVPSPLV